MDLIISICNTCKNEVFSFKKIRSAACPHCGNVGCLNYDRVKSICDPKEVIPFAITKGSFIELVANTIAEHPEVPETIFEYININRIQKLYIPLYTFHGTCMCNIYRLVLNENRLSCLENEYARVDRWLNGISDASFSNSSNNGYMSGEEISSPKPILSKSDYLQCHDKEYYEKQIYHYYCQVSSANTQIEIIKNINRTIEEEPRNTYDPKQIDFDACLTFDICDESVLAYRKMQSYKNIISDFEQRMHYKYRRDHADVNIIYSEFTNHISYMPYWYLPFSYKGKDYFVAKCGMADCKILSEIPTKTNEINSQVSNKGYFKRIHLYDEDIIVLILISVALFVITVTWWFVGAWSIIVGSVLAFLIYKIYMYKSYCREKELKKEAEMNSKLLLEQKKIFVENAKKLL